MVNVVTFQETGKTPPFGEQFGRLLVGQSEHGLKAIVAIEIVLGGESFQYLPHDLWLVQRCLLYLIQVFRAAGVQNVIEFILGFVHHFPFYKLLLLSKL
jgi:hypothetical protein